MRRTSCTLHCGVLSINVPASSLSGNIYTYSYHYRNTLSLRSHAFDPFKSSMCCVIYRVQLLASQDIAGNWQMARISYIRTRSAVLPYVSVTNCDKDKPLSRRFLHVCVYLTVCVFCVCTRGGKLGCNHNILYAWNSTLLFANIDLGYIHLWPFIFIYIAVLLGGLYQYNFILLY